LLFENVGGVGEVACDANMNPSSKLLNVESVHPQCGNLLKNDDVQLGVIKVQIQQWKLHNMTLICESFFAINDNLLIDLEIHKCCGVSFTNLSKQSITL
jgi:hypothetical protein